MGQQPKSEGVKVGWSLSETVDGESGWVWSWGDILLATWWWKLERVWDNHKVIGNWHMNEGRTERHSGERKAQQNVDTSIPRESSGRYSAGNGSCLSSATSAWRGIWKTTLHKAEDAEVDGEAEKGGKQKLKDAKGREILSPEETAKKKRYRIKADKDREKVTLSARAAAFCTRSSMLGITSRVPKNKNKKNKEIKELASAAKLVHNLEHKLNIFTESATGHSDPDVSSSWGTICQLEAEWVPLTFSALMLSHKFYDSELKQEPIRRWPLANYRIRLSQKLNITLRWTNPSLASAAGRIMSKENTTSSATKTTCREPASQKWMSVVYLYQGHEKYYMACKLTRKSVDNYVGDHNGIYTAVQETHDRIHGETPSRSRGTWRYTPVSHQIFE